MIPFSFNPTVYEANISTLSKEHLFVTHSSLKVQVEFIIKQQLCDQYLLEASCANTVIDTGIPCRINICLSPWYGSGGKVDINEVTSHIDLLLDYSKYMRKRQYTVKSIRRPKLGMVVYTGNPG